MAVAGRRPRRSRIVRPSVRAPRASTCAARSAVGSTSLVAHGRQQLAHQEWEAAGRPVARCRERRRGRLAELRFDQPRDRRLRQRRRSQDAGRPVGEQRAEHAAGDRLRLGSRGDHDRERELLQPRQQEGQEPQRRGVGPVGVVDGDHERVVTGQVGAQPVQPVQYRERGVGRLGLARVGVGTREGQHPGRDPCRSLEQVGPPAGGSCGQGRLEQLARHAEGEVALQLAATGPQNANSGGAGGVGGSLDQRRLADAGGALQHEQRPLVGLCPRQRLVDAAELGLAFQYPHVIHLPGAHVGGEVVARVRDERRAAGHGHRCRVTTHRPSWVRPPTVCGGAIRCRRVRLAAPWCDTRFST